MQVRMTEAEFQGLTARAKTQGVLMDGREGVIERMGVKAQWAYDGSALTVNVLDKPFFLSKEAVEQKLRELLGR